MTQRSPIAVLLMTIFVPFYALYWLVVTKNEMNAKFNTGIPTAWILLIPFIGGLWFAYAYWNGAQKVTGTTWLLGFFLMPIGAFVAQGGFNSAGGAGAGMQRAA